MGNNVSMDKDHIRILLIEDDEDDYVLVRELLSGLSLEDFSLEWVQTYQEGLKELCRADHDVYLLDYRLGSRNGLELIREATRAGCGKPIIFLTGQRDHGVDMEAVRSGAADYLVKAQLTADLLERSIRYSIARKKSERELQNYRNRLEDLVRERTEELETAYEELQVEIVERKQAEVTLLESENKFKSFAEQGLAGVYLIQDGVFKYVNPKFAQLFGYTVEECMSDMPFKNLVYAADLATVEEHVRRRAFGEVESVHYTFRGLKKNGQIFHVEVYGATSVYKGRPAATGTIVDITERIQAEEVARLHLTLFEFSGSHSLEELLQKTLDEVGELTNSPVGFYHFVESDQKTLSLQAWSTRTVKDFCKAEGQGMHYAIDQAGVWVDCVHERRPVIHNDYKALPHRKGMPEGHAEVVRELVVPTMRSGRVVAILGIGNKPGNYTENDVAIVSYLADVAWEIVERKRDRKALQESEGKYRRIFETANEGICVGDGDYLVTDVNQKMADMLGYLPNEIIGKPLAHLMFAEDLPDYQDKWSHRVNGMSETYERRFRRRDGGVCWTIVSATPIRKEDGRFMGVFAMFTDITERKRAEAMLASAHRQNELLLNSVGDGIFGLDLEGRTTFLNPKAVRLMGYKPEEMIGLPQHDLIHHTKSDGSPYRLEECPIYAAFKDGQVHHVNTEVFWRKDGTSFPVAYTSTPMLDENGELQGAVAVFSDITERQRAEAEKIQMEQRLQKLEKAESLGRMAGSIAHHFNNKLFAVMGNLELALYDLPKTQTFEKVLLNQ